MLLLNKQAKSITPLKNSGLSRGGRNESIPTPREKVLTLQVAELQRENAQLVKLLKQSKELIQGELARSRDENHQLKKLLCDLSPHLESRLDGALRERLKAFVEVRDTVRMNTQTTSNTEHPPVEILTESEAPRGDSQDRLVTSLRTQLAAKDQQYASAAEQLHEALGELNTVRRLYLYRLQTQSLPPASQPSSCSALFAPTDPDEPSPPNSVQASAPEMVVVLPRP